MGGSRRSRAWRPHPGMLGSPLRAEEAFSLISAERVRPYRLTRNGEEPASARGKDDESPLTTAPNTLQGAGRADYGPIKPYPFNPTTNGHESTRMENRSKVDWKPTHRLVSGSAIWSAARLCSRIRVYSCPFVVLSALLRLRGC